MKILSFFPKDSAVTNYRIIRPLAPLGAHFRRTLLRKNESLPLHLLAERLKKQGDIWVIKYISHFETLNTLYTMRNLVKAKVVVDIDDNIWQIPPDSAAFGNPKAHANMCMMVLESVREADWVTVATEPLKKLLEKFNQNITVLPNYIDPDEWKFEREKHKKIRIGWVYSPTHYPDLKDIKETLEGVFKKYKDRIEVIVFGTQVDLFDFPITKVKGVKYTEYPKVFMEAGIDISIAPLKDNDFNRCKSNIKWLESTMAGAAFVGSKVEAYSSVTHGSTGMLAGNQEEWEHALESLIENPKLRRTLQSNAKKEVLEKYADGEAWRDFYFMLGKTQTR